ncbi:MAG: hypothetical protein ACXWML_10950 [Candidatus Binataceae bacterium]
MSLLLLNWITARQIHAEEVQPPTTAAHAQSNRPTDTVATSGCVGRRGPNGPFYLSDISGGLYHLVGQVSGLSKHLEEEVKIRGIRLSRSPTSPDPAVDVTSWSAVGKQPAAVLTSSTGNPSNWHHQSNGTYGLRFAYPDPGPEAGEEEDDRLEANFFTQKGAITLLSQVSFSDTRVPSPTRSDLFSRITPSLG